MFKDKFWYICIGIVLFTASIGFFTAWQIQEERLSIIPVETHTVYTISVVSIETVYVFSPDSSFTTDNQRWEVEDFISDYVALRLRAYFERGKRGNFWGRRRFITEREFYMLIEEIFDER